MERQKSLAKFLGVIAVSIAPATAGWIDAKADAERAMTAAASERAANESSYTQFVDRISRLEEELTKLKAAQPIAAVRPLELEAPSPKPMARIRKKPSKDAVRAAKAQLKFDF